MKKIKRFVDSFRLKDRSVEFWCRYGLRWKHFHIDIANETLYVDGLKKPSKKKLYITDSRIGFNLIPWSRI